MTAAFHTFTVTASPSPLRLNSRSPHLDTLRHLDTLHHPEPADEARSAVTCDNEELRSADALRPLRGQMFVCELTRPEDAENNQMACWTEGTWGPGHGQPRFGPKR